ncbi:MAG: type II secretion system F family protein [Methanobacteriaceae archaeon]|nr:type II secretion system F family protein [Methanobacteriaceae archaeon]MDP2835898.1 type II secretion system F family protein [Methanobacteriaceae archaeon]MDP3035331.1 type II secretion system F family protein [Methanobacteriaceae archaeon]
MASLKDIFDKIGGFTIDSSKKVGEGVQVPVTKLGGINSKLGGVRSSMGAIRTGRNSKPDSKPEKTDKDEQTLSSPSKFKTRETSSKIIKRMKMSPEEIDVFKGLIESDKVDKKKPKEDKIKNESFQKASLEELLKDEEKEGLDPKLIIGLGLTSGLIVMGIMIVLGFGIEIGLALMLVIFLVAMVLIFLPNLQKGGRSAEASRELPYALRQMATELRAGLGLHDSMRSVAMSGYGSLSEEFARTLEEIKYGETTENALMDMSERVGSDGMKRAIYQITRTLSSGGDLAKTLNVIADDIAYEMRMKLKDYAQKLNSFTMIYMFVAILGPVILMIMLLAASTVMGGELLPPIALIIMYLFFFPLIVGFMAFMIKRLEPKI